MNVESQCDWTVMWHNVCYSVGATEQAVEALLLLQTQWLRNHPGQRPEAFAVSPRVLHAVCRSTFLVSKHVLNGGRAVRIFMYVHTVLLCFVWSLE